MHQGYLQGLVFNLILHPLPPCKARAFLIFIKNITYSFLSKRQSVGSGYDPQHFVFLDPDEDLQKYADPWIRMDARNNISTKNSEKKLYS